MTSINDPNSFMVLEYDGLWACDKKGWYHAANRNEAYQALANEAGEKQANAIFRGLAFLPIMTLYTLGCPPINRINSV